MPASKLCRQIVNQVAGIVPRTAEVLAVLLVDRRAATAAAAADQDAEAAVAADVVVDAEVADADVAVVTTCGMKNPPRRIAYVS